MKKFIYILLLAFVNQVHAQTIIPSEDYYTNGNFKTDNVYFKDVNNIYGKFIGTWECTSGPYYLKIVISKVVKVEQGVSNTGQRFRTRKQFLDMINVDYIFKYNSNVVYNVMPPYQMLNGRKLYSSITGDIIKNSNKISLFYNEPSTTSCDRNRFGELQLTFLPGSTPHLEWVRTDETTQHPASYCENGEFDNSAYQIPANLVLVKVN